MKQEHIRSRAKMDMNVVDQMSTYESQPVFLEHKAKKKNKEITAYVDVDYAVLKKRCRVQETLAPKVCCPTSDELSAFLELSSGSSSLPKNAQEK